MSKQNNNNNNSNKMSTTAQQQTNEGWITRTPPRPTTGGLTLPSAPYIRRTRLVPHRRSVHCGFCGEMGHNRRTCSYANVTVRQPRPEMFGILMDEVDQTYIPETPPYSPLSQLSVSREPSPSPSPEPEPQQEVVDVDVEEPTTTSEENTCGDCPICMEPILKDRNRITTSCGHTFCSDCLFTHYKDAHTTRHNQCPMCRAEFAPKVIPRTEIRRERVRTQVRDVITSRIMHQTPGNATREIQVAINYVTAIKRGNPSRSIRDIIQEYTSGCIDAGTLIPQFEKQVEMYLQIEEWGLAAGKQPNEIEEMWNIYMKTVQDSTVPYVLNYLRRR